MKSLTRVAAIGSIDPGQRESEAAGETALKPHLFELAIQCLALDAQNLGGAALVAVGSGKHSPDLLGLGVGQRFAGALARVHLLDCLAHSRGIDAPARSE